MINKKVVMWALQKKGCPICRIAVNEVNRYARWFLAEYYRSISALKRLRKGHFCQAHTEELIKAAQPHQLVIIYRYLLGTKIKDTEKHLNLINQKYNNETEKKDSFFYKILNLFTKKVQQPVPFLNSRERDCPFCEEYEKITDKAILTLVSLLNKSNTENILKNSDNLCVPHLTMLANKLSPGLAKLVLKTEKAKLEKINFSLAEYERKQRIEYQHESTKAEEGSWIKAAKTYVGEWPLLDIGKNENNKTPED